MWAPGGQRESTCNRSDAFQISPVNQQPRFLPLPPPPNYQDLRKTFPPKLNFTFCSVSISPQPLICTWDSFKVGRPGVQLQTASTRDLNFPSTTEPGQQSKTANHPRTYPAPQLSQVPQRCPCPRVNRKQSWGHSTLIPVLPALHLPIFFTFL